MTYLIMAPGQHDIVETAIGLVDTIFRRVDGIVDIRVIGKRVGVYDLI